MLKLREEEKEALGLGVDIMMRVSAACIEDTYWEKTRLYDAGGDAPAETGHDITSGWSPVPDATMLKAYKNLSPKTRLYFGIGVMAWGTIGLYLSDKAEEKYGFTPSEEDKEALWKYVPKVTVVERTGKE
ncbi:hypothetical protein E4U19_000790 [Claviceps sp. Clav32 group G5]|nr:hypothetical protein E4U19_000790 [Claviceps sp. Clav32 group G5]